MPATLNSPDSLITSWIVCPITPERCCTVVGLPVSFSRHTSRVVIAKDSIKPMILFQLGLVRGTIFVCREKLHCLDAAPSFTFHENMRLSRDTNVQRAPLKLYSGFRTRTHT